MPSSNSSGCETMGTGVPWDGSLIRDLTRRVHCNLKHQESQEPGPCFQVLSPMGHDRGLKPWPSSHSPFPAVGTPKPSRIRADRHMTQGSAAPAHHTHSAASASELRHHLPPHKRGSVRQSSPPQTQPAPQGRPAAIGAPVTGPAPPGSPARDGEG